MDYFKHTISQGVLSYFNPIMSLKPKMRGLVNRQFVTPIIEAFFAQRGGVLQYEPLDTDLLKSNIDFEEDLNFVKGYLYKSVIENIWKGQGGTIGFKPRFVVTFDEELTPDKDETIYPYEEIFKGGNGRFEGKQFNIRYGTMTLGEVPILFFIRLHLPTLIRFLKVQKDSASFDLHIEKPSEKQVLDMTTRALNEVRREMETVREPERLNELRQQEQLLFSQQQTPSIPLQGRSGNLRINLQWNTIDDLDLHVIDPDGNEINYQKKEAICQGKVGLLDVDANAGTGTTTPPPQENISWKEAPSGEYKVFVVLYNKREHMDSIPFSVQILGYNSLGMKYAGTLSQDKERKEIATFSYSKERGLYNFEKLT